MLCAVVCASLLFNVQAQPLLPDVSNNIANELSAGRKAFDEKRLQDAEKHFQRVLAQDSKNVEAYYRLGQVFWAMQQTRRALTSFAKASELGRDNATLQMSLAGFYEQARMMDLAVEHYRQVISLEGESALGKDAEKRLNLVLVKEYAAAADIDTALQLLQSMLEEYPNDSRVLQHLGFAYLLGNRFESAAAIYEEVLEKDPDNDSAHMNIAGVYEKMGNLEAAVTHFKRAAELAKQPGRQLDAQIRAGVLSSQFLIENGDTSGAIKELEALLELKPDLTVASNRLSKIYLDKGDELSAQKVLEDAIEANPNSLDMRMNLASIYAHKKNYVDAAWELGVILKANDGDNPFAQRARQLMQQIRNTVGDKFENVLLAAQRKNNLIAHIKQNPDDAQAHFNLGGLYVGQRRYDKAREHFEKVVEYDEANATAHLFLGEIYSFVSEHEKSANAFARYISLEKNVQKLDDVAVPYASALGGHFLREEELDHALHHFQRVVALNEKEAYSWYQVGVLLSRKGELDEAIEAYDQVLTIVPENSLARFNRGLIYEQLGRESEAFDEYQNVAINEKNNVRLKDAADAKLKYLGPRLNGLTARANYSYSFTDNSNLSEFNPRSERTSALSASFVYRYRYSDDWLLSMKYDPTYTTYHVGHYDYLSQRYEPSVTYGRRGDLWVLSYRLSTLKSILTEDSVNTTSLFKLSRTKSLSNGRSYTADVGWQRFKGATSSRFDSNTYTLSGSYSRKLGKGVSDQTSYTFTYLDNIEEENEGAAYFGNSVSYNLSKWFSQKLALSTTLSWTRNQYREIDRFTRFANSTIPPTKRLTTLYSVGVSANYRQSDRFSFFASLTYQKNQSNLPVLVLIRGQGDDPDIIRPIRSEELIGVPLTSSSLGPYEKINLSFGLRMNF